MIKPNKPEFTIPDDLFDNPKREAKVAAVQKLMVKEPGRIAALIKRMLNKK
jgi:hypothetical protein